MTDGIVTNWDDMNHVWDHTFEDVLAVDPKDPGSKIMLTTPPLNPTASRRRLLETMFERYNFSALSLQVQAALVLYGQGNSLFLTQMNDTVNPHSARPPGVANHVHVH